MESVRKRGLAEAVRVGRREQGLTLRQAGEACGVSAATIMRIERGGGFDLDTLAKVCAWLNMAPEPFVSETQGKPRREDKELSTPEAVAVYLRADPNLDDRTAQLLVETFRELYRSLAKRGVSRSRAGRGRRGRTTSRGG